MRFNKSLTLFRLALRSPAHTKGFARRVQNQIVLMFTLVFLCLGFRGSGCMGGLTLDM